MLNVCTAPDGTCAATVFLLHGRGMGAGDLAPFASSLGVPACYRVPDGLHALVGGGRSWWPPMPEAPGRDLADTDPPGRIAARRQLREWLQDPQIASPGAPRVLVGFSQGGMLACDTVLMESLRVDGLALLSSSRIAFDEWRPRLARLAGLPVLVAHGRDDAELPFAAGERLRDCAIAGGARVDWLPFDGGHGMPLPVWRGLRKWLRAVIDGAALRSASEAA